MKAVLLTGGEESLFNPLSKLSLKALLPIGNRSVIEYLLHLLKKAGITDVLIMSSSSTGALRKKTGDGRQFGVNLRFFEDDYPRGPAGCLIALKEKLQKSSFLVMSPVYPGGIDLGDFIARHRKGGKIATAAVTRPTGGMSDGFFEVDEAMDIVGYVETPFPGEERNLFLPLGMYVFEPTVFNYISTDSYMDIREQLVPTMIEYGQEVQVCNIDGNANRLGNVKEYIEANRAVFGCHNGIHELGRETSAGIFMGKDVKVSPDAVLNGPIIIGDNVVVEKGARIHGPAVIGENSLISEGSLVRESILWAGTRVLPRSSLMNSIACRDTEIKEGTTVKNAVVNKKRLHIGEFTLAENYFAPLKLNVRARRGSRFLGLLNALIKRGIDLTAAIVGLALLSLPMLFIALAIKIDSPGPIVFSQSRRGKGGRKFRMIKFRSMVVDADKLITTIRKENQSDGPMFKIRKDPRLTRIGQFLRRTSLDEIPQLFNVLTGAMSLVGPRPLAMAEMKWSPRWRDIRLRVKPGITGMWQIKGRSDSQFHDWIERDIFYVQNQSLWLDMKILFETVKTVFRGDGAY
jgi:lipopolysaccharide/colanic/teichoic acid biosynthesis glycosyltransferase/dTDP-glucose pyrophosphorylase